MLSIRLTGAFTIQQIEDFVKKVDGFAVLSDVVHVQNDDTEKFLATLKQFYGAEGETVLSEATTRESTETSVQKRTNPFKRSGIASYLKNTHNSVRTSTDEMSSILSGITSQESTLSSFQKSTIASSRKSTDASLLKRDDNSFQASSDELLDLSDLTLENLLKNKIKELQDALTLSNATCRGLASAVESYQNKNHALQSEFESLRHRYAKLRAQFKNTLWSHCVPFHPRMRYIPLLEPIDIVETSNQVGRYKLGRDLGVGRFSTVKMCTKDDSNEELAVKIVKKDEIVSLNSLFRVSLEIKILRECNSKYVVHAHDVIQTASSLYMVVSLGARDMFEFLRCYPTGLHFKWLKNIALQTLLAVDYIHKVGICHRDLKPENILLDFDTDTGEVRDLKLCDFGLAMTMRAGVKIREFCGSPGFFAPELMSEQTYFGDEADIWSIGCIILELVFGHGYFCDIWMIAYNSVLQIDQDESSVHVFSASLENVVDRLPKILTHRFFDTNPDIEEFIDFILLLVCIDPKNRKPIFELLQHSWLRDVMVDETSVDFNNTLVLSSHQNSSIDFPVFDIDDSCPNSPLVVADNSKSSTPPGAAVILPPIVAPANIVRR